MPGFERRGRSRELPPSQLESLQRRLADVVIKRGRPVHFEGMYALDTATSMPQARQVQVSPGVAKRIFYEHDDLMIPKRPGVVEHLPPHHINPPLEVPGDPVYEFLSVRLDWALGKTALEQRETYWIHATDGQMSGAVATDLYQAGKRISPNNITRSRHETDEELREHIRDLFELERPMTAEDATKLQLLTRVIR